jgi:putative flavoprotein involved in K+ transport
MLEFDTILVGGGQSSLACAYYLNRANINFTILDDQKESGGAWLHGWDSLTLFSPADYSSLPGYMMPRTGDMFPSKQQVIDYLKTYESRYKFPVQRPGKVNVIEKSDTGFNVISDNGSFSTKTVISATGTWHHPFIPDLPGLTDYQGKQTHSAFYKNAGGYEGKKVLIVGAGNSGAQILSELSEVANTRWATQGQPKFLPDDVDGRVLFNAATEKYHAIKEGKHSDQGQYNLGNIVMVPPVKRARDRKALKSNGSINRLTTAGTVWNDGLEEPFDEIIWCTGFGFATQYLKGLVNLDDSGKTQTVNTRSSLVDGLWLVGYGNWTGFASATLVGVGRSARQTVAEVETFLSK